MLNTILYIIFLIFLIIYLGVIIVVSGIFIVGVYQTKLDSLLFGSICFILVVISQLGVFFLNFNILMERIFFTLHYLIAIFFVRSIFYKDRKSLFSIILILTIIGAVILNYVVFLRMMENSMLLYIIEVSLDFLLRFIIFVWLAWSSYSAYKKFKNVDFESWIKSRFKLTAIVALMVSLYNLNRFFLPWNVARADPNNTLSLMIFGITAAFAFIISIGFFLAWITPKWYKNYLNRDYEPSHKNEYTETEILEIIKYLANILSKRMNLKPPAIRGVFKLAIKDELGPFKPLNQVNYGELKNVLENSFRKRLLDLNIQKVEELTEELKIELIRGQSLIMMANF